MLGLLLTVVASTILLLASPVAAQGDGGGSIAIHIEGAKAGQFRDLVLQAIPEGVTVIEEAEFRKALARAGLRGPMGYAVTSPGQRGLLIKVVAKAVGFAEIDGAVIGRVRAKGGGLELVLLYVDPAGDLPVDEAVSMQGGDDERIGNVESALAPVLDELAPEPEPEPEPVADEPVADEPEEEEDEPSEFESNVPGSELFSLEVGMELGGRWFSYSDPLEGPLCPCRPYQVFGVPGLLFAGEIFPLATLGIPAASDIGLTLSYLQAFGLSSQTQDGLRQFGTSYNRFTAGIRYRIRLGERDEGPVVLGIDGKLGLINFTFEPDGAPAQEIVDEISSVGYVFLRLGLDARIPIGDVFYFQPNIGYVGPLEGGEVYDRFTDPSLMGLDMGIRLGFVLGAGFEIRTGVQYTRFASSFTPVPGDAYVAGGALDEFVGGELGVAYLF